MNWMRSRMSCANAGALMMMTALLATGTAIHAGGTFEINWHTIDAGGGTSTSANFELISTIGQHDAGYASSANFEVAGGFHVPQSGPTFVCVGDLVDSATFAPPPDGVVDGADLAVLLGEWGANPGSPADFVESATFAPPPDGIVDGADLAVLLGAWGDCTPPW